ncbi:MAG: dihydrolipoamide dehydrogenase [Hyphomicrobiales bacterium]|nr:MAG: dihydrolipoamide dehydrogenase [Hyphomicrobiales bacterium]
MTETLTPDICVIGAGSGGLTVAAATAGFGVPVVLIEKDRMGGDCLNTGCVPSKALIAAAGHAQAARAASAFGIGCGDLDVDFSAVHAHVHDVIAGIAPHDSVERFTGLGVHVIKGAGRFVDKNTVAVGDTLIKARRFVVATGSSALIPPIPGIDTVPVLTNETIFELTTLPEHLVILGGGPIGMELAQAFRRLGSAVTVVEMAKPLAKDDPDMASVVVDALTREGVMILAETRATAVARDGEGIAVTVEGPEGPRTITGSHLLVAAGRKPNLDGLGLAEAGIASERSGIVVDKGLRTTNRRVYAIGDVAGGLQFTHVAGYHAGLVIRSALFRLPVKENRAIIPWVTYTDPELAHVGLTEADARTRHGDAVRVLTWSFADNDRARAERRTEGKVKVIATKRGRILGADIVGVNAGELIAPWALAISAGLGLKAMTGFIPAYPTLSEVSRRVALTHYIPGLTNPFVRRIIAALRLFG